MSAVLKKEVVPKKVVRKTTVRKAVSVPKKTTTKKEILKKDSKTKAKTKTKTIVTPLKRTAKKEAVSEISSADTVFVPSGASLRLLEKAELYRIWYKNNFPVTMAKVAQAGGYVFILAGTLFATASYFINQDIGDYSAAVVCTDEICNEVADAELPASAPIVTFKNSLPELLKDDTDFVVHVQNSTDFKIYLKNLTTGVALDIVYVETMPENMYRYLISPQGLSMAAYSVIAEVKTSEATYKFSGPQFSVQPKSAPVIEEVEVVEELSVGTTTVAAELEAEIEEVTEGDEAIFEISTLEELPAAEEEELPEEAAVTETETTEDEVDEEMSVPSDSLTPITASIDGTQSTRYLKVNTGTLLPLEVKVFSQVGSSEQPLYLGLATLVQGEWVFSLSALALPSVTHLIYASFDVDGVTYRSEGVSFAPIYKNDASELLDGDVSILVQKIDLALLGNEDQYQNRAAYFSGLSSSSAGLFERSYEEQFADGELLDLLDEYMQSEEVAIDNLLARHAHISQVGKKYLLTLSGRSAQAQAQAMTQLIAEDRGDASIVPTLNTVLALRYETLRELVSENESRLNQDTSSLTSRDTDQDGVSDYDEIVSYTTNPSYPDTDQDGVLDAVEIITGSDPLLSDVLMVVASGGAVEDIVFDEVVSIEQVEPLVVRNLEIAGDTVQALVFGKSIPNSYVYIVSPTLGTVGVIKSNETGVFSYTIEQAITDGRHEVYAVLTDTQGAVVASSKPRVFTKTQNTFVAAAVGSQNVTFDTNESKTVMQFSTITTALGVVALGLVLLLLTHALRSRQKGVLSQAK